MDKETKDLIEFYDNKIKDLENQNKERELNMSEKEFTNYVKETLDNIYSKIDNDEKKFISNLVQEFNNSCETNKDLEERIENAVEWLRDDNKSIDIVDRKSGYDMKRIDIYELLEILEKKEV